MQPDWRDKQACVAYYQGHTHRMWAWEFLRHNPDYITYWDQSLKAYKQCMAEKADILRKINLIEADLIERGAPHTLLSGVNASKFPEQAGELSKLRHEIDKLHAQYHLRSEFDATLSPDNPLYCHDVYEKWEIEYANDPQWIIPPYFQEGAYRIYLKNDVKRIHIKEGEVLVKLKLTSPLNAQLDAYNKELRQLQSKPVHDVRQRKERVDMIRALRASLEGVKHGEANKVLYPKQDNRGELYRTSLSRARKIATDGYKAWL